MRRMQIAKDTVVAVADVAVRRIDGVDGCPCPMGLSFSLGPRNHKTTKTCERFPDSDYLCEPLEECAGGALLRGADGVDMVPRCDPL